MCYAIGGIVVAVTIVDTTEIFEVEVKVIW